MTARLLLLALVAAALALAAAPAYAAERVYVGDASTNLFAFDRDDATGALTPLSGSPFPSGAIQDGIVAGADGSHLYATGYQSNSVNAFLAPPAGGSSLTALPGSPFTAAVNPSVPALTVDGRFLYAPLGAPEEGHIGGYSVDRQSGALTPLAGFSFDAGLGPWKAVAHPNGRFLAVSVTGNSPSDPGFVSVYRIERATGELTEVAGSPVTVGVAPFGIVFSPDGRFLYVGNEEDETISAFSFSPTTGHLTPVSGSPFPGGSSAINDIAITPSGRFLYAANNDQVGSTQQVTAFAVDQDTGALSPLATPAYDAPPFPTNLAVSGDSHELYLTTGRDLRTYRIGDDGALTELPDSPYEVSDTQTLAVAAVPVPPKPAPGPSPTPSGGGTTTTGTTTTTAPGTPLVPPTGTGPSGSGPMRLIAGRHLRLSHGRLRLRLRCGADPSFPTCAATLSARARLGRRVSTIARRSVDLDAGKTTTVVLRFSARARRALADGAALRVTLALAPAGRPTLATHVRLSAATG